jgi:hypothetical protein
MTQQRQAAAKGNQVAEAIVEKAIREALALSARSFQGSDGADPEFYSFAKGFLAGERDAEWAYRVWHRREDEFHAYIEGPTKGTVADSMIAESFAAKAAYYHALAEQAANKIFQLLQTISEADFHDGGDV